ncbi:cytochrome P450 [Xylariomycetidae sp. FL0641]|nr:cytochrome P450 [Xylariomycetidae sp. FL0641]
MHRRYLSHAFSAKSIRDDEVVVQKYIDMFIEQVGKLGGPGTQGLNVSETFNWITFDIIGDLTFGEPFNAVAEGKSNFWISLVVRATLFGWLSGAQYRFPFLKLIMPLVTPDRAKDNFINHRKLTNEKLNKRIAQGNTGNREDFLAHSIRKGNVSYEELRSNSIVLIIAGSETTATALAATTYFLLTHPATLARLQREVRGAFATFDQITGDATNQLPYLHAVVEEGLRLFPPVPFGLPRVSPGTTIDGHWVPAGTIVSTDTFVVAHDPRNFAQPYAFRPERWLTNGEGDNCDASKPFSLGPRACLGVNLAYLELRLVLAKMVYAFDWELLSTDVDWWDRARCYVLWEKPAVFVRYHPRKVDGMGGLDPATGRV